MEKIIFIIIATLFGVSSYAQDFASNVTTAKNAYKAGKLEEAHFALQKAMQEIDITIGREVLKLLPSKMDTLQSNANEDNVAANVGFVGATVHRSYGKFSKKAEVSVISNSPMVAMLNTFLNSPMLAGMGDANSKTIKIQGYKARLEKREGSEGQLNYELQVPLGSALISFKIDHSTESEAINLANTLPLAQLAKLIQ